MIAIISAAILACGSPAESAVADSVAKLFDQHRFVFMGSTHGDEKSHRFLLCLLSRPGFQRRVTDVVVEWASPVHQRLIDRYFLTLDRVPPDSLHPAWFDTDYPPLWATIPRVPEFFAALREINEQLPAPKRLRVVGGNEPVAWATVRTTADLAPFPYKNNNTAHLILEHLAPRREARVLVIYGIAHVYHDGGTMMASLEEGIDRDQLYVIGTIQTLREGEGERVARYGNPDQPFFLRAASFPEEGPLPEDLFYAEKGALASHIDAMVYLGPSPDRTLTGTIAFTGPQNLELARRAAILKDYREAMQIRLGAKSRWFATHPADFPERP